MDYPGKVITKTQVTPTQTSASGNWTLDDQAAAIKNNNWPVALVPNPISKSLRFNSADSAYLNRTFVGTPNTYTLSMWVKRGSSFGSQMFIVGSRAGSSTDGTIQFNTSNQITVVLANTYVITTTAVYRDPAAWYHLVLSVTASGTAYLYINNVQAGSVAVGATCWLFNSANTNTIGRYGSSASLYYDGYLTEINFIDGQALTPSSFGMTNPQTGQWIPLKYSGTYGTNGFYLNFKDATSTTTLGYDYSGNANNWTTNNFSVTAGAGNDSLTDVPTPWIAYNTTGDVGGVIRGNYCTWNPLRPNAAMSYANGNLDATSNGGSGRSGYGTFGMSSGKWYFETTGGDNSVGIANISESVSATYSAAGSYNLNGTTVSGKATYTTTDLIGCAYDATNGTIEFFKNGVSQGSSSFSAGLGLDMVAQFNGTFSATRTCVANFGQRPFAYTPPTGFLSLCTTNLPATAIGFGPTNQGDNYFGVTTWTGNGGTLTVSGLEFTPEAIWIKRRDTSNNHRIVDVVRGYDKEIYPNLTNAEGTFDWYSSITSTGYVIDVSDASYNANAGTYVGWNWKAGGTGVSNTAGTITSTVSANTTAGFSIVTYTGTSANATVGHGLGVAPSMVIVKNRDEVYDWPVWHTSIPATNYLYLDTTSASSVASSLWNNTAPTSTVFSIGTSGAVNNSTKKYVAYCFAAVPGYSAFGSFGGNGTTDNTFIYTGFRPKFALIKRTDSTSNWFLLDSTRSPYNVANALLRPNLSDAEITATSMDFVSNGIKLRDAGFGSGETYIYMAFAESPFQFSNAR
jgi:hypothetical protein